MFVELVGDLWHLGLQSLLSMCLAIMISQLLAGSCCASCACNETVLITLLLDQGTGFPTQLDGVHCLFCTGNMWDLFTYMLSLQQQSCESHM